MPLWVWNGDVNETRILEMLDQFAANGIGGVFVHARPGLVTEYLSDRWFELWAFALREATVRGLECHVYDENSFPSGFAGGHTLASDPEAVIRSIEPDGNGIKWGHGRSDGWTAYQPLVSLTRKKTVETFLQVTHEAYARHFQHAAGQQWKYCFTDEPTMSCAGGLYATPDFLAAFQEEHGYDLVEHLGDYLSENPDVAWPVRFDYWSTANRLFTQNFCRTMHDWCDRHGVQFTGHFDEHAWPSPLSAPDCMAAQRWMQMPGIDLLGFQFNANDIDTNQLYTMTIREVVSIAHQLGQSRTLCECYGGGGYGYTLDQAKALSITLLAHGLNFLNPHISMQSVAGARKYDWAQTISDHAPWWAFYRDLADHDARASFLLAHSTPVAHVLVLQPTLSGWLHAIPKLFQQTPGLQAEEACIRRLRESHGQFLNELTSLHIGFELGDEFVMSELGRVKGGALEVGTCTYDLVIIPPGMETMLPSTLALLHDFLSQGGTVYAAGPLPCNLDGRPDERPARLASLPGWHDVLDMSDLAGQLQERIPTSLKAPAGMLTQERVMPDGRRLFMLANPSPDPEGGRVCMTTGLPLEQWDPATGEMTSLAYKPIDGVIELQVTLPPRTLMYWIETDETFSTPAPTTCSRVDNMSLSVPQVERLYSNVMVLPTCSLLVVGQEHHDLQTIEANERVWKAHGFIKDPWEWTIQYKRQYVDHVFAPESGYEVTYTFRLDPAAHEQVAPSLRLGLERPWLYVIELNGIACPLDHATRWLDEDVRALPIGAWVKPGVNHIRLTCAPMNIHAEIAPVYLLGDFAVREDEEGLFIGAEQPLTIGSWLEQGLPFYPWDVRYTWTINVPASAAGLMVELDDWRGSALRLRLDGVEVDTRSARPWSLQTGALSAGPHTLAVDVIGNLNNLLGPFFTKGLPIPWTWMKGPDKGNHLAEYGGLDRYGLFQTPKVGIKIVPSPQPE